MTIDLYKNNREYWSILTNHSQVWDPSLLMIPSLQGLDHVKSGNHKWTSIWLLTFTKNSKDHLLDMYHPKRSCGVTFPTILCLKAIFKVLVFDFCWPPVAFDLLKNSELLWLDMEAPTYQVLHSSNFPYLRYHGYTVFTVWPPRTPKYLFRLVTPKQ